MRNHNQGTHSHARVDQQAAHDLALARITDCLREKFGILHSTVQLEHERCVEASESAPSTAQGTTEKKS